MGRKESQPALVQRVVALASGRTPIDIGSPALYLSDGQALCHGLVRISQKGDHHYGDAKEERLGR